MSRSTTTRQVPALEARLRALHEISMELARMPGADELCRRAVELGVERLGFDRLGIWFLDPRDSQWLIGTWGVDEAGLIRDERGIRLPRDTAIVTDQFYEGTIPIFVWRGAECFDAHRNSVGRSDKAAAPLWDGYRVIGEFCADNLLSNRSIGDGDQEVLVTYARIVAHLCSLKKTEAALKEALSAKAVLLSELQHRTKNSFTVINGLIRLEANRSTEPALKEVLRKLGNRVSALTSLYSHLDMSAGNDVVHLDEYLKRIAVELFHGYGADEKGLRLATTFESVGIDIKRAVSLGIIENELVTDSLKHAFPTGRMGTVSVALRREGSSVILAVEDDGVGLPADFVPESSTGLGIALVRMMCEEIAAGLELGRGPGAAFSVKFTL